MKGKYRKYRKQALLRSDMDRSFSASQPPSSAASIASGHKDDSPQLLQPAFCPTGSGMGKRTDQCPLNTSHGIVGARWIFTHTRIAGSSRGRHPTTAPPPILFHVPWGSCLIFGRSVVFVSWLTAGVSVSIGLRR